MTAAPPGSPTFPGPTPPAAARLRVWLADLTYTQQTVAADVIPQAVGGIATFTESHLGLAEPVRVFKYPERLIEAIEQGPLPDVIGFSNYCWNHNLAHEFVKLIKRRAPRTVTVFGGPNYPVVAEEQEAFLRAHLAVDFYIQKEGELAFAKLVAEIAAGRDVEAVKAAGIPSVHSIGADGAAHLTETIERIRDLAEIPSPYTTGKMDEFFDGVLMPILQTNRGCPFSCTFCVEGVRYYNKVHRSTAEKLAGEIDYIGRKMAAVRGRGGRNDLFIADSNFGMYREDVETCRMLARSRELYQWPEYINVATGKNQKERVLEASRIIEGALRLSGSVQSLDPGVLKNIKRDNISAEGLMDLALAADDIGANSYSEIILGLPGDSKEAHYRTVKTVMEAGFTNIYLFQLMLLPGTEMATEETKTAYGMRRGFRVLPRCYGDYEVGGERIVAAEIEEICVANATLSFEDYLECRNMHLIVTLFYNDSLFGSLLKFFRAQGIPVWRWIELLRDTPPPAGLAELFASFREATIAELWPSRAELEAFVREPGVVQKFIDGQLGNNLLFVHKSRAVIEYADDLAAFAAETAKALLRESGADSAEALAFVSDAAEFHRLRMSNLFRRREVEPAAEFRFDLRAFSESARPGDFMGFRSERPITYRFTHDESQRAILDRFLDVFGDGPVGVGRILSRVHTKKLFRHPVVGRETVGGETELRYRIAGLQH